MSVRAAVSGVRSALGGRVVVGTVSSGRVTGYMRTSVREQVYISALRQFSITPIAQKKKAVKNPSSAKEVPEQDIEVAIYDPQSFKSSCDEILAHLKSQVQEVRMGKADLRTLSSLKVQVGKQKIVLDKLGQVSMRGGRHIVVSVYDPETVKAVSAGILAANLNMNPQIDPSNPQTLLIPVPPPTRESREATVKSIKALIESAQKSVHTRSVHHERAKAMAAVKLMKQASYSKDMTTKLESQIEKINKEYLGKLSKMQDEAAQAVMRS
ncbi:ribosome recycling factor-domain-containing protein [Lipomyces tetrasporus]|uniref:Ribosome-recycling factor, mitochondrial n=1 Tax=Lipomyces tetrasporus TaxID=54092 RepID=A0AAD7QU59_9ASCO|nr:ribosome recycling factor-domain-containing protein [Lipomyces tetrasporus]KAJ8101563.1 ribosome recycling factor-domain-containing protein [Lipomyces tetrasporus]